MKIKKSSWHYKMVNDQFIRADVEKMTPCGYFAQAAWCVLKEMVFWLFVIPFGVAIILFLLAPLTVLGHLVGINVPEWLLGIGYDALVIYAAIAAWSVVLFLWSKTKDWEFCKGKVEIDE